MQPLFLTAVQAGFPSPADDYIEKSLSLDEYLVTHPAATFFVRVIGASMQDAGIYEGDIVVVNRSLMPRNGDIVIAVVDGEFLIKTLLVQEQQSWLVPANPKFPKICLNENQGDFIWGVVSGVVRRYV